MMRYRWPKILAVLLALAFVPLLKLGCGGQSGNPAAAPAPPVELPTPAVLKFVNFAGLNVDLSTINIGASPDISKVVLLPPANVSEIIALGPLYQGVLNENFLPAIDGIEQIEIPADVTVHQFAAQISFTAAGILTGAHSVKIDFAPFDYDNDGVKEACSGNTAELPICVRFWLDDAPYIAGVIEEVTHYPSGSAVPDVLGKGKFKLSAFVENLQDHRINANVLLQYLYGPKTEDTTSKQVDYAFKISAHEDVADPTKVNLRYGHLVVSQVGPSATALKGENLSVYAPSGGDAGYWQYTGQFVEGGGYWDGHVLLQSLTNVIGPEINPPNDCASLPDGILLADRSACSNLGILVDAIPFLDFLGETDFTGSSPIAFPADFPAAPTF